jgi:uncharacterized secreted protein with C-terminal beta-propeller domain
MKKYWPVILGINACIALTLILLITSSGNVVNAETLEGKINNAMVLEINNPNSIINNQVKFVDSQNLAVCPFVLENRTMVPLRFVSENLNATVNWDSEKKEVTITKDSGETAKFIINEKEFMLNKTKLNSDAAPIIVNNRTFVPVRVISEQLFDKEVFWNDGIVVLSNTKDIFNKDNDAKLLDELYTKIGQLPKVGSVDNLLKLIENNNEFSARNSYKVIEDSMAEAPQSGNASNEQQELNKESKNYSETNTQVEGVDEADVVKTDGEFIYQVNNQKIVIVKAYPADNMKIVKEIKYTRSDNENFTPTEIYVDGDNLVVIGNTYYYENYAVDNNETQMKRIMPPYYRSKSYTRAMIYDLNTYECVREIEVEGNYISSRKVDSNIYLITNKYIYTYYEIKEDTDILPLYKDTAVSNEQKCISAENIYYFPNFEQCSYLMVAAFDLDDMDKEVNISTYLGAGNQIYSTSDTLYVTQQKYEYSILRNFVADMAVMPTETDRTTFIYKFDISNGNIVYKAKGEVPGTIINQFSMDEYGDNFRIATTTGDTWNNTSKNNLYILDENMKLVGKIEGLAKGERIYSTRFMGNRCYVVTYRNVDPLFVLDLSDSENPEVLGELKIPGYSQYLHPYDENHLIGIGKDTIVKVSDDWNGEKIENAYEVGMKMAMFDVSDVSKPKELFSTKIGDRGSYSEALNNHKAFLFDKEKNILAFPATVTVSKGVDYNGVPNYGTTEFQGALIFKVDLDEGFKLRGRISHTNIKTDQYGNYNYDYNKQVERILYIDDVLYTLSKGIIKANSFDTLNVIDSVEIEQDSNNGGYIIY